MSPVRRTWIVCTLVCGVSSTAAWAQAPGPSFPYAIDRSDAYLLAAGAGSYLLGEWLVDRMDPLTLDDVSAQGPGDVPFFDRYAARRWSETWSTTSDVTQWATFIATAAVALGPRSWHGSDGVAIGVMVAEAGLLTQGVTRTFKSSGRERPYTYNPRFTAAERLAIAGESVGARLSFFSGHTSSAFAAATFASTVFEDVYGESGWSKALWIGSLSLAASTAIARVEAGKHFPSDVIVGAVVGSAIGLGIPRLHRSATDPPEGRLELVMTPNTLGIRLPVR